MLSTEIYSIGNFNDEEYYTRYIVKLNKFYSGRNTIIYLILGLKTVLFCLKFYITACFKQKKKGFSYEFLIYNLCKCFCSCKTYVWKIFEGSKVHIYELFEY